MPELEDDAHQIIVEKVKPTISSKTEHDKRLEKLEERLKQPQGPQDPTPTDLSIYSKVKMPEKFKMPEFEKYDGTTCPRAHLQMYLVRMTQYVSNVPLMIQLFQSSLVGLALRWWRNLAAQISPEPTDFELRKMFIKTLPYEYRNRMVTTIAESFNQLIPVGEQIEIGLRDGWFTELVPVSRRFGMKKDKEPLIDVNATYTASAGHLPTV
ncbi:uncharacterized protein LOC120289675 [Eucalyptus grandis]|uniref:uncharacterized protein LOC120289675 n=1 Tax=Eucalyptus grandis TaxID=71139 RepID=UPI00192ECC51|nr:uncharacterized protein LOC120289675 [Eucalyptus grandis]